MHTITTVQERRPVGTAAYIAAKSLAPVTLPSERRVLPAATHTLFGSPELIGITMTYDRNSEIYGEGEPADYVYKVISGAVRTYKVLNDGRRQINAFYLPGDCFGLDSMMSQSVGERDPHFFHVLHRAYLWVTTAQWAMAVTLLVLTLKAWQAEDAAIP